MASNAYSYFCVLHFQRVSQLRKEVKHWRNLCQEQESSLSEMTVVVSFSKLEADNLRESHSALQEAQWTADSLVPNCSQCHLVFSVSRRRHHCRNCGLIFCHFCSTQTMALPSAASQCASAIGVTICYIIDTQPNLKAAASWWLSHPLRYEPVI
ncbi:hypothetical protein PHET_10281 [Paragonimus heterotremus]|uniref:FYVE-type domain-containing protein n=1 Tax=Paragonimus heterotremus TaxID=100268 RepID=A0A8J4WMQ1_9TREM|nr:hypothetical protein PHET_10281 [Paragonimus heterotremus]